LDSISPADGEKSSFWHRRRTRVAVLAIFLALLIVCAIAFSSLFSQNAPRSELVSFLCRSALGGEASTLALDINISDGMDRDEAVAVVYQVHVRFFNDGGVVEIRSAQADSNGTWTVEYCSMVILRQPDSRGHALVPLFYRVVINPFERTIEYGGYGGF
jgi:hypothetical protein